MSEGSKFCSSCGNSLQTIPKVEPERPQNLPPNTPDYPRQDHDIVTSNKSTVAAYGDIFKNYLLPDETLLNAAPSIHIEVSEKYGKGTGDGTIGVTDLRFLHVYSAKIFKSSGFAFNRSDIVSVSKNRIILPGSSNLKFIGKTNGAQWCHNFYCNNSFCKEITGDF
jgi:hypothetical protein